LGEGEAGLVVELLLLLLLLLVVVVVVGLGVVEEHVFLWKAG
jgi:hypothetical protein